MAVRPVRQVYEYVEKRAGKHFYSSQESLAKMASRPKTVDSIRRSRVTIPDLETLLRDWPQATSPNEGIVRGDVQQRLERVVIKN